MEWSIFIPANDEMIEMNASKLRRLRSGGLCFCLPGLHLTLNATFPRRQPPNSPVTGQRETITTHAHACTQPYAGQFPYLLSGTTKTHGSRQIVGFFSEQQLFFFGGQALQN